jgi:hypothetical protein
MCTRSNASRRTLAAAILTAALVAACGDGGSSNGPDAGTGDVTISQIASQTIDEDGVAGPLPFTISPATAQLTAESSDQDLVPNGNIQLGGSGVSRTVTVTPAADAFGMTTIKLTARVGSRSASTSFSLTVRPVNDAPTIDNITDRTTEEGVAIPAIPFTVGDAETAPASLTVTATSDNTSLVPAAGLVLGGSGASRTLTVTPAPTGIGSATITVTVSDGMLEATDTFVITVSRSNAVNDPPVNHVPGAQKGPEDEPLVFSSGRGNDISISDVDAGNNPVRVTLSVSGGIGTLTLSGTAGLSFQSGDGTADTTMTFTGTIAAINAALNGLRLVPPQNFSGSGTLTITTNDLGNTGTGGAQQDSDTIQIDIEPVNDLPTVTSISDRTIQEDATTGPLAFIVGDVETPAGSLVVTRESSNPEVVPLSGVVLGGSGANRTVTVTPAADAFGSSIITLIVSDGTARVTTSFTVNVTSVEDDPKISDVPNQSMNAGEEKVVTFTISDAETAAADLTVTRAQTGSPTLTLDLGGTGTSRTLTIKAPEGMNGTVTITLTVTDAAGRTARDMFTMRVDNINDPPVLSVPEETQLLHTDGGLDGTGTLAFTTANPLTVDDDDIGGAALKLRLRATHGTTTTGALPDGVTRTAGADGSADQTLSGPIAAINEVLDGLLFTSSPGYSGTAARLELEADDQGAMGTGGAKTDTATVSIKVNVRPTVTAISNRTINEDATTGAIAFTINDFEQGTSNLTVTATSDNPALVPSAAANLVLGGSGGARTLNVRPLADESGTATITVRVVDSDGGERREAFLLTVNPVNDAPVITAPSSVTTTEDVNLAFIGNISVSDVDDTTLDAVTLAATNGTVSLGSTVGLVFSAGDGVGDASMTFSGSVANINAALHGAVFHPALDFNGAATLKVTADDGSDDATKTINVTVVASNDAPIIDTTDDLLTLNTNTERTIKLSVSDVDVTAGQQVEVTLVVDSAATLTLPVRGGLTFSAGTGTGGESSLTFRGNLASVNASLNGGAGGIVIKPMTTFNGDVTLTATVSDLGNTGPDGTKITTHSWVTTYANANTRPTITTINSRTIMEDAPNGNTANFTIGDNETAPGNLMVTVTATPVVSDPVIVTMTLGGSGAMRSLTLIPAPDDHGKTNIRITVSDGVLTAFEDYMLTVTPVNDAPVILPGTIVVPTFDEDTSFVVSFSATDVDGTQPTMAISSDNVELLPNRAFTGLSRTEVTITPEPDLSGSALVTLTATDGTLVATKQFMVNVRAVNDPPELLGTYPDLEVNDKEVGGGTYQVTIDATGGTVTLVTIANLTFSAGDGNQDTHMVFRGSRSAVNAALDGVIDSVTNGKIVIVLSDLGVSPPTELFPEQTDTLCVARGTGTCP